MHHHNTKQIPREMRNFHYVENILMNLKKFKTLKNGLNYIKQKNKDKKTVSVVRDCEILSGK